MDTVETIRRIGFKRWYERQLVEGHGWLVTVFLALIAVASCIEVVSFKDGLSQALLTSAFAVGCVALGIHAWQRYLVTMTRAEAAMPSRARAAAAASRWRSALKRARSTPPSEPAPSTRTSSPVAKPS